MNFLDQIKSINLKFEQEVGLFFHLDYYFLNFFKKRLNTFFAKLNWQTLRYSLKCPALSIGFFIDKFRF